MLASEFRGKVYREKYAPNALIIHESTVAETKTRNNAVKAKVAKQQKE
jgi:hypothetical protein